MDRARRSAVLAVFVLFAISAIGLSAAAAPPRLGRVAAAVPWQPSAGLLLAETITGGISASDEYVELTNAGSSSADLSGLELVYVTSTGATITRKAVWSGPQPLEPGQHLLVANTLGLYAPIADATYSGGLAATGGALVLRVVGGSPIDALAWGDATNSFVEGSPASAPPARSSIERKPGGLGGNVLDTNDNGSDWLVNAAPAAQNLLAPPVPAPQPTPTPSVSPAPSPPPSVTPTPIPTPSPSADPSPSVDPSPSADPSPSPEPSASPEPSPSAEPSSSPEPSPTPQPSAEPSSSPSASPSPSAVPAVISIAEARALPVGSAASIEGVLTTRLGVLESGRAGFVQDGTAGIGVYVDLAVVDGPPAGTIVVIAGVIDERYGQRTLRAAVPDVRALSVGQLPDALPTLTGATGEALEGSRVQVSGPVIDTPGPLSDGTGLTVDDGTGPVRIVVTPGAMGDLAVARGSVVTALGPLGQRDSSGTGESGYRVFATIPGEFAVAPVPNPSPTPEPTPDPTPTPSASPIPTATPTPTPVPTPSPTPVPTSDPVLSMGEARLLPIGSHVLVRGVVTAEAGRLGTPPLFAIQDGTAGLIVHRPEGIAGPARGTLVEVSGVLAAPNGQLELRPANPEALTGLGASVLPAALAVTGAQLGEATEARLVLIDGAVAEKPSKQSSGDLAVYVTDQSGVRFRAMADVSSGIVPADLVRGRSYRLTGVVGQRASRRGALDGYRVWLRDRQDVSPLSGSGSTGPGSPEPITIARALLAGGEIVTIQGSVTVGPTLLDGSGRRIVVQDASAAVEVRLPQDTPAARVGQRLRVTGTMGRAYGAPRLTAQQVVRMAAVVLIRPLDLRVAPGPAHEWRLVRAAGVVLEVHRLGDRWRAELLLGSDRVPVVGLPAARIPSVTLVEGRHATIVGIVRRPYPSAADRRFAIEPRGRADLAIGPPDPGLPGGAGTGPGSTTTGPGNVLGDGAAGLPLDIDIGQLGEHVGQTVRVGGIVAGVDAEGVTLDDGTARGFVVLRGDAASYLAVLRPGEAVNAIGRVEGDAERPRLVVTSGAGLVRVGELGEVEAVASPAVAGSSPAAGDLGATHAAAGKVRDLLGLPTGAGLVSLLLVAGLSLAVTALRRRRVRRALADHLATRLAAIASPRTRMASATAAAASLSAPVGGNGAVPVIATARLPGDEGRSDAAGAELGPRSS